MKIFTIIEIFEIESIGKIMRKFHTEKLFNIYTFTNNIQRENGTNNQRSEKYYNFLFPLNF